MNKIILALIENIAPSLISSCSCILEKGNQMILVWVQYNSIMAIVPKYKIIF